MLSPRRMLGGSNEQAPARNGTRRTVAVVLKFIVFDSLLLRLLSLLLGPARSAARKQLLRRHRIGLLVARRGGRCLRLRLRVERAEPGTGCRIGGGRGGLRWDACGRRSAH